MHSGGTHQRHPELGHSRPRNGGMCGTTSRLAQLGNSVILNSYKTMMKKISKTLVRLSPGQFDMKTVADECGNDVTPREAGKEVRRLNGRIMGGVRVRALDAGRRLLVSLQNV